MYFRLCNLPETFQRMINSIFWELLYEGVLVNYMNNFIILARMMKELKERTIQFLKIAEKHNLCFKWSKCDFNMEEIPILGVIVRKGQVKMEQEKIKAIKEWKMLTKVKDVESFLGFAVAAAAAATADSAFITKCVAVSHISLFFSFCTQNHLTCHDVTCFDDDIINAIWYKCDVAK